MNETILVGSVCYLFGLFTGSGLDGVALFASSALLLTILYVFLD